MGDQAQVVKARSSLSPLNTGLSPHYIVCAESHCPPKSLPSPPITPHGQSGRLILPVDIQDLCLPTSKGIFPPTLPSALYQSHRRNGKKKMSAQHGDRHLMLGPNLPLPGEPPSPTSLGCTGPLPSQYSISGNPDSTRKSSYRGQGVKS